MENTRCKAFIECVDRGSITAAAESLGYTPSAVSQLVAALEKELGLTLLKRSQRGVTVTTEGSALLPVIRAYLADEKEIYQTASALKGVVTGTISIATYPSVATAWLPEIVRRYKNDYPGVHINIMEGIRSVIYRQLDQNQADMGFTTFAEPMPYEWIPLIDEPIIAALPEDHPFAGADSFPTKECENSDFILGSWGEEKEILDILERNNVSPVIKYTTYDTPATLAMVRMGLGISLVNELSARYWNEHLVKLPLDPPETITFGIAIPARRRLTNAANKFLQYALEFFREDD